MLLIREIIDSNLGLFLKAIYNFSHLAEYLVLQLRQQFSLFGTSFKPEMWRFELKVKSNQRGILNNEWKYSFLGRGCRFENLLTGQIVNVFLGFEDNFRSLEEFKFVRYLRTSLSEIEIANLLGKEENDDYKNIEIVFSLLKELGFLIKIENLQEGFKGLILCDKYYNLSYNDFQQTISLKEHGQLSKEIGYSVV
jgi:hypothetical protein